MVSELGMQLGQLSLFPGLTKSADGGRAGPGFTIETLSFHVYGQQNLPSRIDFKNQPKRDQSFRMQKLFVGPNGAIPRRGGSLRAIPPTKEDDQGYSVRPKSNSRLGAALQNMVVTARSPAAT